MPVTFRKVVARPGIQLGSGLNGTRRVAVLTKEDLELAAKTTNEMIADGHLIPSPYSHQDDNGLHPLPLVRDPKITDPFDPNYLVDGKTKKTPSWDRAINSGFWKNFSVNENGELEAEIEAEGDENDENSHAGRIKKTFRQVSPFIHKQFVDGDGKIRRNAIMHVAVTNKGVQPGQKNFENVASRKQEEEYNLAMALALPTEDENVISLGNDILQFASPEPTSSSPGNPPSDKDTSSSDKPMEEGSPGEGEGAAKHVADIVLLFQEKFDLTFPDDTDENNFIDRLKAVLSALPSLGDDSEDMKKPPVGTEKKDPVMAMSTTTDPQASPETQALLAKLQSQNEALLGLVVQKLQSEYKGRIENLVRDGRIAHKFATEELIPQVDAFSITTDQLAEDGSYNGSNHLELALRVLENNIALGLPGGQGKPANIQKLDAPGDMVNPEDEDFSTEDIEGELASLNL